MAPSLPRGEGGVHNILYVAVVLISVQIVSNRVIINYDDTGIFPDALTVVRKIKAQMQSSVKVITTDPEYSIINFYLWYLDVPISTDTTSLNNKNTYYVVPQNKILDLLSEKTFVPWIDINGTKVYR
jgi:hypothetical protein